MLVRTYSAVGGLRVGSVYGAAPGACVVVEDSLLGARAGIAAGCRVMGFAQETDARVLAAVGAVPFATMAELPALLGILD